MSLRVVSEARRARRLHGHACSKSWGCITSPERKVRVVNSNALERRHLAFWGRFLIGKGWKTKARSSLYCQNRGSQGLVRVFSERQHITRRAFHKLAGASLEVAKNRWRNSIESRPILLG